MRRLPLPSFPDLLFAVMLAILLARGGGYQTLLSDGDTGWHIRTGEWILAHGAVPRHDPFSFSRPGAPWMAWEWLSDVLFARLYGWGGLVAVAGACAAVLCLASALLLAWLLERGSGLWLACGFTLLAASASTVHYLARPHVFSILLFTVGLWLVDRDRRRPSPWIWLLPGVTALWTNLHGGFALWCAAVWLLAVSTALEREWRAARRYTGLAALCSLASLLNPYGWQLHRHIAGYLASSWIASHVQEFQPPSMQTESMLVFAVLAIGGAALAARAAEREGWFEPLLVWALVFAALRSARHIPLYAIAAAPVAARECARWWQAAAQQSPRSAMHILWTLGDQLGHRRALTAWACLLGAAVFALPRPPVRDFSAARFPCDAVTAERAVIDPAGHSPRILTSDQWADYLIFHLYPRQRVFFDGRSDFYGEALGTEYADLMGAAARSRDLLDRHAFDLALLPHDWPLERVLESDPGWERIYRDKVAALFRRRVQQIPQIAETGK